ncbi:MAG: hypothetical protein JNL74_08275, partial [Fibrobacteres bacterium]|nr:hypothetical protein [Fibrobacterota bacterium]
MKKTLLIAFAFITILFLYCSKDPEKINRVNPLDISGTNYSLPTIELMRDTTVGIKDTVKLHGNALDSNGRIVKCFWKSRSQIDTTTLCSLKTSFKEIGIYQVIVTVVDNDGLMASDTMSVTVNLYPPKVSIISIDTTVGMNDSFVVRATAKDTSIYSTKYFWSIDSLRYSKVTNDSTFKTAFALPGTHKVFCVAIDDDSNFSNIDTFNVTVERRAPTVSLKSSISTLGVNDTLTVTASAKDDGVVTLFWSIDSAGYGVATSDSVRGTRFSSAGIKVIKVKVLDADGNIDSTSIQITVKANEAILQAPSNNSVLNTPLFTLNWIPGFYTSRYQILLDTVNPPVRVAQASTTDTSYTVNSFVNFSKSYYWRVVSYNASNVPAESPVWNFSVSAKPAIVLVSPSDASTLSGKNANLVWNKNSYFNHHYSIKLDTVNPPVNVKIANTTDSSLVVNSGLNFDKVYYWSVTAYTSANDSNTSVVRSFSTAAVPPVNLIAPANNVTLAAKSTTLSWNRGSWTRFKILLDTIAVPVRVETLSTTDTQKVVSAGLAYSKKYYWQVRAYDADNDSSVSPVWGFTTPDSQVTPTGLIAYYPFNGN